MSNRVDLPEGSYQRTHRGERVKILTKYPIDDHVAYVVIFEDKSMGHYRLMELPQSFIDPAMA